LDISLLAQSLMNGLLAGWIYILIALGMTLVLSIMGIVQLAHGEIYMLGAYVSFYFFNDVFSNFLLAIIVSTFLIGLFGVVIEKYFFRPVRGQLERALIVALGLILILQNAAVITFGGVTRVIPSPFPGVLRISGITLSWERLIAILIGIVLVGALVVFIQMTKTGQAMVAISQDLEGAALQGINVNRVSSIAMFLGSGLAAAAGSLMGAMFSISPFMGGFALMKGIAVIILGGLGSIPGAVIGGLIIGLVDGMVPLILSAHFVGLIGGIVIILILILRPQGIMGHPSQ
jgi:branched-chain amino acid transport system permease protein